MRSRGATTPCSLGAARSATSAWSCSLVFRSSDQGEWQEKLTFAPGQTLSPLAFPDVEIAVSDVLAP